MGRSIEGILAFGWNLGNVEQLPWRQDEPQPWYDELIHLIEDTSDHDDLYTIGRELPPDPWDEIRNHPDSWFYEDYRPGEYSRRETAEFVTWKAVNQQRIDARYRAEREARDAAKWTLEVHGSDQYKLYILTLKEASWTASYGETVSLELTNVPLAQTREWTIDLHAAVHVLGFEPPENDPPGWILAAYGE